MSVITSQTTSAVRAFALLLGVWVAVPSEAGNFEAYVIHHQLQGGQQTLYRVVLNGASSTLVPVAPQERPLAGTAVSPAGALLGLDGFNDEVVRVDVATGGVETVVALEVLSAPGDATAIPALTVPGLALFVSVLAAVALLLLRRMQ